MAAPCRRTEGGRACAERGGLMSAAIVVAIISGATSLAAAGIALMSSRSVARLGSELEEKRRVTSKHEQAEELRARYRDPLLGATFDLQSRLYNIVAKDFLVRYARAETGKSAYAIDNTLYLLAQYLAWVEIIRREIQFLDLGEEVADRRWLMALEDVHDILARDDVDAVLCIFRGEQRAIGEVAIIPLNEPAWGRRHESLGYAQFAEGRHTAEFDRWFKQLQADVELLAAEPRAHLERVAMLQNGLIDILDILDPDFKRFPAERRTRLKTSPALRPLDAPGRTAAGG
jgi:hypothetical protein